MINVWRLTSGGIWLCLLADCDGSARPSLTGAAQGPVQDVANAIRVIVADGRNPALGPLAPGEREQLTALYGPEADAPLWVDASGRPSRNARDALALLSGAADEGLDPVDYNAAPLELLAATLEAMPTPSDVAAFDTGLSVNTLRYLRHLHAGRVDPRVIGFRMTAPADDHDYTALLRMALARHRITDAAAEVAPPFALYVVCAACWLVTGPLLPTPRSDRCRLPARQCAQANGMRDSAHCIVCSWPSKICLETRLRPQSPRCTAGRSSKG